MDLPTRSPGDDQTPHRRYGPLSRSMLIASGLLLAGVLLSRDWQPTVAASGDNSGSKVIEATEFRLVDEQGNRRGSWQVGSDGSAVMALCDTEGNPRVGFEMASNGFSSMLLFDGSGNKCGMWGVDPKGDATFALISPDGKSRGMWIMNREQCQLLVYDKAGTPRSMLGVNPEGDSALSLFTRNHQPGAMLSVGKNDVPGLALYNPKDGELRLSALLMANGMPSIGLLGTRGVARGTWFLTEDGSSHMTVYDPKGHRRAILGTAPWGEPKLLFYNERDQVILEVP